MISVVTASCVTAYAFYTTAAGDAREVPDRPPGLDPALRAVRDLPLSLSRASEGEGRQPHGRAPDRPPAAGGGRRCGRSRSWPSSTPPRARRCRSAGDDATSVRRRGRRGRGRVMREIRERIAEKKRAACSRTTRSARSRSGRCDAGARRARVPQPASGRAAAPSRERWNYPFGPEHVYGSSRGGVGPAARERSAALLQPDPEALLEPDPDDQRALAPVGPQPVTTSTSSTTWRRS